MAVTKTPLRAWQIALLLPLLGILIAPLYFSAQTGGPRFIIMPDWAQRFTLPALAAALLAFLVTLRWVWGKTRDASAGTQRWPRLLYPVIAAVLTAWATLQSLPMALSLIGAAPTSLILTVANVGPNRGCHREIRYAEIAARHCANDVGLAHIVPGGRLRMDGYGNAVGLYVNRITPL